MRDACDSSNSLPRADYQTFRKGLESADPAIFANVIIGLTRVTSYLPDRQLKHLEQAFLKEGGLRERMTKARLAARKTRLATTVTKRTPAPERP